MNERALFITIAILFAMPIVPTILFYAFLRVFDIIRSWTTKRSVLKPLTAEANSGDKVNAWVEKHKSSLTDASLHRLFELEGKDMFIS